MIEDIFLDMDGVLCQFVEAALRLHSRSYLLKMWPEGEYDILKVTDISEGHFWGQIAKHSPDFWRRLQPYPWAKKLLEICREVAPVTIATSPTIDANSVLGKLGWLKDFTGDDGFRDYMIGPAKHLLARPGVVLIDDCEANCQAFERRPDGRPTGGRSLLFPRPWNKYHAMDAEAWVNVLPNMLEEVGRMGQRSPGR